MALPGKPARPCPLPLLLTEGAPLAQPTSVARPGDPGALPEERTLPRLGHRPAERAAAAPCPVPGAGGLWSRRPAPAPRGFAHLGIAPFPGRARTRNGGLLAPGGPARRGHAAFTTPGFCPEEERRMHRFIPAFGSGLCPPAPAFPIPLLGRDPFGWGRRGARGERAGGPRGAAAARCRCRGSPAQLGPLAKPGASSDPRNGKQPSRSEREGGDGHPTTGSDGVRGGKERGGGDEGCSPRPSGSSGGCG